MRTRLHRTRGTNQHKEKVRVLGLKHGTWALILAMVLAVAIVLQGVWFLHSRRDISLISPIALTSFTTHAAEPVDGMVILSPEQEQDWQAMKRMAHKLAPLYEYPAKVIIAQMALESARGTSKFCVERNNCFGIGAYDRDPNLAWTFENKEQAIVEYMRLIKNRYPEAYAQRHNPDAMIQLIKDGGYASDPHYVQKLKKLPEWGE